MENSEEIREDSVSGQAQSLLLDAIGQEDSGVEVSDRVFTVANVITFIRLLAIPVYFVLLLLDYSIIAAIVFGLAALTDCLDGQIARRTNTVTKIGRVLDPAVDRLLIVMGVLGVYIVGRLPLWIILLVLGRDLFMLFAGAYILSVYHVRVDVIFLGKVVTTCMMLGFFGLMMNWPLVPGLGLVDITWLPGLNSAVAPVGIWAIYLGLALGAITTTYYIVTATKKSLAAKAKLQAGGKL